MITLVKRINQYNHVFFMPHAFNQSEHPFNQNEHPFGQCKHFNQVEPFDKPQFFVVVHVSMNLIGNHLLQHLY